MEKGQGTGSLGIPDNLNSGFYTLRFYTQAMRNRGNEVFGKQVLIILNPAQTLTKADTSISEKPTENLLSPTRKIIRPDQKLQISIYDKEKIYPQRTKVTLKIETKDKKGKALPADLSVSVSLKNAELKDKGLFTPGNNRTIGDDLPEISAPISFPAESKGIQLKGKVVYKNSDNGISGAIVFLAFPGKKALVYTNETNSKGEFSFLLPKLYGLNQIVLQAIVYPQIPVEIMLEEEFHPIPPQRSATFILPDKWKETAHNALLNAQIGQAYSAFEPEATYRIEDEFSDIPFFGIPEARYLLDDYTRFPLPEFFYEVVSEVRSKGRAGEESLTVINDWQPGSQEIPPLLLVDGVPVFDQKTFLQINNKLIASADIVTAPFWLNPGIFDGIIQITSFEGDARSFELPENALRRSYLTLLPQKEFVHPDFENQQYRELPDFRNTLYWNPRVQTDVRGKATISFFTSDAVGEYEVNIEGVTDKGLLGSKNSSVSVVKAVK